MLKGSLLALAEDLCFFLRQDLRSDAQYSVGHRQMRLGLPTESHFHLFGGAAQARSRILKVPAFDRHRKNRDGSLRFASRHQGDRRGAFTQRCESIVGVVDVAFGKYDQWLSSALQNIQCRFHRLDIGVLSIDTETAAALHRFAFKPTALRKNLPSGHHIEGNLKSIRSVQQAVGIPVKRMIWSDHHPESRL